MTLPPIDYDKLPKYRWTIWTLNGQHWANVEGVKGGPFDSREEARKWIDLKGAK
jgi:hypothetical protein